MLVSANQTDRRLSPLARCLAGVAAATLTMLLAGTAALSPDPRGMGTHEQLGWGPCTFATFIGVRCPSCGMTTAWAHLMHGQPLRALATHVVGTLSAVMSAVGAIWLLLAATGGRWRLVTPLENQVVWLVSGFVLAALVEWAVRVTFT